MEQSERSSVSEPVKPRKQAVVLIHGIGEQKPMDTLRSFVKSVVPQGFGNEDSTFRSRPDRMSDVFELRRLDAVCEGWETHFYEYYWAYLMRGTKIRHVLAWLRDVLLTFPWNVPKRGRLIWCVSWALIVASAALLLPAVLGTASPGQRSWNLKPFSILTSVAWALLNGFLLWYVGDVARYVNPAPDNIAARQQIRRNGVRLLRRLHRRGEYERIILVGHSLGSIIGYDLIRQLWIEYSRELGFSEADKKRWVEDGNITCKEANTDEEAKASFSLNHERRRRLRRSLKGQPQPRSWLISDFITLGSPLAYAQLLLAKGPEEFKARKRESELPTCPPQPRDDNSPFVFAGSVAGFDPGQTERLHHAAPFAVIRWVNLYYPGDFVGGELCSQLGDGIEDYRLKRPSWSLRYWSLLSHTTYWRTTKRPESVLPWEFSVDVLRGILWTRSEVDTQSA